MKIYYAAIAIALVVTLSMAILIFSTGSNNNETVITDVNEWSLDNYNPSNRMPTYTPLPQPACIINDFIFDGRFTDLEHTIFYVEFFVVEDGSLVPKIYQTFGNSNAAFSIWAELNNVYNVELDNDRLLWTLESVTLPSGRGTGALSRFFDITLSSEFMNYFEAESGLLLADSLANTFIGMWRPVIGSIRFNLIVSDEIIHSVEAVFDYEY